MPTKTEIPTTSVFATKDTDAKDVQALIAAGLEHMQSNGDIAWKDMPEAVRPFNQGGSLPIGYSRAWLIVRRAYLEVNEPKALVTLPTDTDATKQRIAQSKVVVALRQDGHSWGEIAVRCGVAESKVRKVFRLTPGYKDLGDRIGKGGRFAYDEPEFYLAHRKAEGAHIPADLPRKPKVDELLNAKDPKTGKVVKFTRSAEGKTTRKAG